MYLIVVQKLYRYLKIYRNIINSYVLSRYIPKVHEITLPSHLGCLLTFIAKDLH